MTQYNRQLSSRQRKMHWRATHRGMKEMDVVMTAFVRDHLATMSEGELDEFERLLEVADADLMDWLLGRAAVPEKYAGAMSEKLLAYRFCPQDYNELS